MNALFQLTPQAIEDLDAIWWTIAEDNRDAGELVEAHDWYETELPGLGMRFRAEIAVRWSV